MFIDKINEFFTNETEEITSFEFIYQIKERPGIKTITIRCCKKKH